jgi:hypothetical protein
MIAPQNTKSVNRQNRSFHKNARLRSVIRAGDNMTADMWKMIFRINGKGDIDKGHHDRRCNHAIHALIVWTHRFRNNPNHLDLLGLDIYVRPWKGEVIEIAGSVTRFRRLVTATDEIGADEIVWTKDEKFADEVAASRKN